MLESKPLAAARLGCQTLRLTGMDHIGQMSCNPAIADWQSHLVREIDALRRNGEGHDETGIQFRVLNMSRTGGARYSRKRQGPTDSV